MTNSQQLEPVIGNWYRSHGQLFEVVAMDDEDEVIEIQHADGSLEEVERDDWMIRIRAGSLATAEPPESAEFATDHEDEPDPCVVQSTMYEVRGLRADALEDLDLFE